MPLWEYVLAAIWKYILQYAIIPKTGGNKAVNSLGNSREQAENKLILLYFIEKINIPVSNLQIIKIFLEHGFMNYFLLQQSLNELCEGGFLIPDSTSNNSCYLISENGKRILDHLSNLIPIGIKARIDNTIHSIRRKIKNETLITADFIPESENEYIVSCAIREGGFMLLELKAAVGTREDARAVCENWKKNSQAIYAEVIQSLIKKRSGDDIPVDDA